MLSTVGEVGLEVILNISATDYTNDGVNDADSI